MCLLPYLDNVHFQQYGQFYCQPRKVKSKTIKVSFCMSFHQEAQWQRARLNDLFPQQQVSCNFSLVKLARRTPPHPAKKALLGAY